MNDPGRHRSNNERLHLAVAAMKSLDIAGVPEGVRRTTHAGVTHRRLESARRGRRYAVATGAAILIAACGMYFQTPHLGSSLAFADVAEKVKVTKTLKAVLVDPREGGTLLVSGTRTRFEGQGPVVISDSATHQQITLDSRSKLAYRTPQKFGGATVDFYGLIQELAKAGTESIESHIDAAGRRLPGHRGQVSLKLADNETWKVDAHVWSDPVTKVPVRVDIWPTDHPADDQVIHLESIEFNVALDEALFDMSIPAGYTVMGLSADQLQPPPDKAEADTLTIVPRVGIGTIRFGMSREQIVDVLGEPEFTLHDTYLSYPSKGLQLVLAGGREANRLGMIIANPADAANLVKNDFPGKTDRGIRIGSTVQQVLEAYGEPESRTRIGQALDSEMIAYKKLLLSFGITAGKVQQILLSQPR